MSHKITQKFNHRTKTQILQSSKKHANYSKQPTITPVLNK